MGRPAIELFGREENENSTSQWAVFDRFDGAPVTQQALLIKVKNAIDLAKAQGKVAAAAANFAPATIEGQVYSTMKTSLADALKGQGVDADISIVVPGQYAPAAPSLVTKIAFAAGGAAAIGLVWFIKSRMSR